MNCRRCGEILNANANFCWSCGAPQHEATSPETVAVPVVSVPDSLYGECRKGTQGNHGDELVIVSGPEAGGRLDLDKEFISAGRHEQSDLCSTTSRSRVITHCSHVPRVVESRCAI